MFGTPQEYSQYVQRGAVACYVIGIGRSNAASHTYKNKVQGVWKNFNRKNFTIVGKTSSLWEKLHRVLGLKIFVGKTSSKFPV